MRALCRPGRASVQPGGPTRGPPPAPGTPRTLGLRDVDEAAEDLAHPRLQGEVLGAAGHGDDQVGRFQVPVLGQQLVEGLGVRVAGQPEVLRGEGESLRVRTPAPDRGAVEVAQAGGVRVPPQGPPSQRESSGLYPEGTGAPVRASQRRRNRWDLHCGASSCGGVDHRRRDGAGGIAVGS